MQAEDKKLLEKFLYGTCTAEEIHRVQELLTQADTDIVLQELTLREWNEPSNSDVQMDVIMASWKQKLHSRIADAEDQTPADYQTPAEDHTAKVHEFILSFTAKDGHIPTGILTSK